MTRPKVLSGAAKRKRKQEKNRNILMTNKKIKNFFKLDSHAQSKFLLKIIFKILYFCIMFIDIAIAVTSILI